MSLRTVLFTALVSLFFTTPALAQQVASVAPAAPEPTVVAAAPALAASTQAPTVEPITPGFVLRVTLGPQLGFYATRNGGLHYAGRLGLFVGHDLVATGTADAPVRFAIGYAGSLSANHLEVLHRHGAGLSLRLASATLALSGGVTIAHTVGGTYRGSTLAGGHILFQPSFQWSTFTVAFPFEADFFRAGGTVVPLLALGVSLGVSTN